MEKQLAVWWFLFLKLVKESFLEAAKSYPYSLKEIEYTKQDEPILIVQSRSTILPLLF